MQFNSYAFILLFFPLFLLVYFTVGKRRTRETIILGGLVFYAFAGWESAAVLGGSVLITACLAQGIDRSQTKSGKRLLTALCILLHAAALVLYKYWWIVPRLTSHPFDFSLVQPLGFSFFSFQQMMYVLALCRGELERHSLPDYLAYILYFPKLTMGPLAEPGELIPQFRNPGKWNWDHAAAGLRVFSFGLFKKMVIADTFAGAVNSYFQSVPEASSLELALIMLSYTFQIYFDFSGYIDMSVGISHILNLSLPLNFDSPYKAVSISDFWKRWHISLTRFFTRNIYIPLGGNRKGPLRTDLNIMIVFLVSGMWHGAHPNFLLWGALNGVLLIIEKSMNRKARKAFSWAEWLITFLFINCLWLLFRSGTVGQWAGLMRRIFSFRGSELTRGFTDAFFTPELVAVLRIFGLTGIQQTIPWVALAGFMIMSFLIVLIPRNNHRELMENRRITPGSAILAAAALTIGILCMSSESIFIYSGF